MACCSQTLSGWERDCSPGLPGVKEFYATCHIDAADLTVSDGVVTAFPTGTAWSKYEVIRFTTVMNNALTYNDTSGLSYWTNTYEGNLSPMSAESRAEMMALMLNDLSIVVRDGNDNYWLLGYDTYVKMTDGSGTTGTGLDDTNQYTFTLTDYSRELPLTLSSAAIASLTATA